ncbi:MAG: hypothetical protein PWR24_1293 [Desulfonauticus sp.]|nr:hypothetical protein [Desulfonauticus sp.]
MEITFWGVRGGIPVSGKDFSEFGGDTPCVQISLEDKEIIIDSGTGIRELGQRLLARPKKEVYLFYTHFHWDHILGLPFFAPLYLEDFHLKLVLPRSLKGNLQTLLHLFSSPYFPVDKALVKDKFSVRQVGDEFHLGSLQVLTIPLSHPNGGVGYKFSLAEKSFVYLTDNELGFKHVGAKDFAAYVDFCLDVDLLVHDAEFLKSEYEKTKGWGHSLLEDVLALAEKSRPKMLALMHHNQKRTDKDLYNLTKKLDLWTKNQGINSLVLRQGQKVIL